MPEYRYPWPASALSRGDMSLLHKARETSPQRTTITQLIVDAVRRTYAHLAYQSIESPFNRKEKNARIHRTQAKCMEENSAA